MLHQVLILAHNNLTLTRRTVASVRQQDIPGISIFVVDNDSTDGTREWLIEEKIPFARFSPQLGVSAGWNYGLDQWFSQGAEHVFVFNNDIRIAPWFCRSLHMYRWSFVSGAPSEQWEDEPEPTEPTNNPCFSAFLIRRSCWYQVGKFDEDMKHYASDCSYHVRAHRMGIPLINSNLPFYHETSSTLRNAPAEEREAIEKQADADREVFRAKYGTIPGEPGYADLFL